MKYLKKVHKKMQLNWLIFSETTQVFSISSSLSLSLFSILSLSRYLSLSLSISISLLSKICRSKCGVEKHNTHNFSALIKFFTIAAFFILYFFLRQTNIKLIRLNFQIKKKIDYKVNFSLLLVLFLHLHPC